MLYSIISEDVTNSLSARQKARPTHLARLEVLQNAGRLVLAGPNPAIDSDNPGDAGFSGSVVIAEFASLEDAKAWADADPYVAAGVYQNVAVKPFKQVFPNA
ncbi:YciI family protein [Marinomonas sp. M1K-6]|uniref:YciI family protein n=1 Tax=Marinomonas profundi TaxID=2726122 RepID=A0A847QZX1_9GAMM|nr:YciI family protein [Marinomonas profundi]NLQ16582.1 YciI family protein [Marinomonas profundi]UDV03833.1 YciI family protein [Marinomonas profundi]